MIYHRNDTILESYVEEGGTRGKIIGLIKESCIVSHRGESLVH
jgi:hypothetical protein